MGVTVTKAGPYFDGGASPSNTTNIKFSQMRDTFRLNNPAGAITASELRRDNSTFSPDPIVPDCTENSDVATSTNWKVSQIKASIKYYYITQTLLKKRYNQPLPFGLGISNWNQYINRKFKTWGKNIPEKIRETLKKMLNYDRSVRPTAKELYENREIFDCDSIIEDVKNQDLADFAYV